MGSSLSPGQSLTSADGYYQLILQRTGALIGYSVLDKTPFWGTALLRSGNFTAGSLILKADCNLALYDNNTSIYWATNTNPCTSNTPYRLVILNTRNIVLFDSLGNSVWQSNSTATVHPTNKPSFQQSPFTSQPSNRSSQYSEPSIMPSSQPTFQPVYQANATSSKQPTFQPSTQQLKQRSYLSYVHPQSLPGMQPSSQPSYELSQGPSQHPMPSSKPTMLPSSYPRMRPTMEPSKHPNAQPSNLPSLQPSCQPSKPSGPPSAQPSNLPSSQPSIQPSCLPLSQPSSQPSNPSGAPSPSKQPFQYPTFQPSKQPFKHPTSQPSFRPTYQPTYQPILHPSTQPLKHPSSQPSKQPFQYPTFQPSKQPFKHPTSQPSFRPTYQPTYQPILCPSTQPSKHPSTQPSKKPLQHPSSKPSKQPFKHPTSQPRFQPTYQPTYQPILHPTKQPSRKPTSRPSRKPFQYPSSQPSKQPFNHPTSQPSFQPTNRPTDGPTMQPSVQPSRQPFSYPSKRPSKEPSSQPTFQPFTQPRDQPTVQPIMRPSIQPLAHPSKRPRFQPTMQPTDQPIMVPSNQPTFQPSTQPYQKPTFKPVKRPSVLPSAQPFVLPTLKPTTRPLKYPTSLPSIQPTNQPSYKPNLFLLQLSSQPSTQPWSNPSRQPDFRPSCQPRECPSFSPSIQPSKIPTVQPRTCPTERPSKLPTVQPNISPSLQVTIHPSTHPTASPNNKPTLQPSLQPSSHPTFYPSHQETFYPTLQPSSKPTSQPSLQPTLTPRSQPTFQPASVPSVKPFVKPSKKPSRMPSSHPSIQDTSQPSNQPFRCPSFQPTAQSSYQPTAQPFFGPSRKPSQNPNIQPSIAPTCRPFAKPSDQPTVQPYLEPSMPPTSQPVMKPSKCPSEKPSTAPNIQPTLQPSGQPLLQPTKKPSKEPSLQPILMPSVHPTFRPASLPSTFPSGKPFKTPSVNPSNKPIRNPSSHPSKLPTSQPSNQPLGPPSFQPTSQPSDQPVLQPTKNPSSRPSVQPIIKPSLSPTFQLVLQPSSYPTFQPSAQPARWPSCKPFKTPSVKPTKKPIGNPTSQPTPTPTLSSLTLSPSVVPSYSLRDLYIQKLNSILRSHSTDQLDLNYFDLYFGNQYLFGGCSSWNSFINNDLGLAQYDYVPQIINFTSVSSVSPGLVAKSMSCEESIAIANILRLMTSFSSGVVQCRNITWVVDRCSEQSLAVCIDCSNPCQRSSTVQTLSIAPCQPKASTGIAVFFVSYRTLLKPPDIYSLAGVATSTSIRVTASLSSSGVLHCGAFSTVPPAMSSYAVLQQNYNSATDINNISTINIVGLIPLTSYSLFCYTYYGGLSSSTADMISNRRRVNTTCCKSVTIEGRAKLIMSGTDYSSFFSIGFIGLPSKSMDIFLSLNTSESGIYPARFTVTANDKSMLYASLRSLPKGLYRYSMLLSGPSAHEYSLTYTGGNHFRVLSSDQVMPAPFLYSVEFSNDGSYLTIKFDSPTNRGNTSTTFNCHNLFTFPCSDSSTCTWMDDSTVYGYLSGKNCALPNDNFGIKMNTTIKARCLSVSRCPMNSKWPNASPSLVKIRAPPLPVKPRVVISAPFVIGSCDNLTIDLTLSSGNGGRGWKYMKVTALGGPRYRNVSVLQNFLDTQYKLFPPTKIPYTLITKGYSYTFTVMLCNFLTACSSSSISLIATNTPRPVLSIVGGPSRKISRNSLLFLSTITSVVDCGAQRSSYSLNFEWILYQSGSPILSIASASKDQTKYILPPYTLKGNTLYTIKVTASIRGSTRSSSYSVDVLVNIGDIHAVVAGGLDRFIALASSMVVDASGSYDDDQYGLTGENAGLSFQWSCQQLQPHFNETCRDIFAFSSMRTSTIKVSALHNVVGVMGQVTLVVTDSAKTRSARSLVSITILQPLAPLMVALQSNINTTKMNPGQRLQLTGVIKLSNINNVTAVADWAVSADSISLSSVARTPVSLSVFQSPTTAYLVIPPYQLTGEYRLVFSLKCRTSNSIETVSFITIIMNSPPKSGYLQVQPTSGVELQTKFDFANFLWTDEDLPLEYQMGYISSTNLLVVLQTKSEYPGVSSLLPAGMDSSSNILQCFSQVYDALNANSTSLVATKVTHGGTFSLEFQMAIIRSTNLTSMSLDEVRQSNAISSYVLNFVNCTAAPNCSHLNRFPCVDTINTCGSCKSIDYFGQVGDSNTPCYPIASKSRKSCLSAAQCLPSQECTNRTCLFPSQSCPNSCSGHGTCSFVDATSGFLVSDYRVDNKDCQGKCICHTDFKGSDSCGLNKTEILARQAMRSQLIDNVFFQISQEYPTEQAANSWMASIVTASRISFELDNSSINQVFNANNYILSQAASLQLSSNDLSAVLPAVNSVASAPVKVSATSLLSTLQLFSSSIVSGSVPGEAAFTTMFPTFNMAIFNLPSPPIGQRLHLSLPQSNLDTRDSVVTPSTIYLPSFNNSNANDFQVSMISLDSIFFADSPSFYSNPLSITHSNLPCELGSCNILVHLQNSLKPTTSTHEVFSNESVTTVCKLGVHLTSNYTCRDGYVINTTCNGLISGTVVQRCPSYHSAALCASMGPSGVVDKQSRCELVNVTISRTVCSCQLQTGRSITKARAARMLGEDSSSSSNSTSSTLSVTAVISTIADSVVTTVFSAQDLSAEAVAKDWVVLATIGTFIVITLGFMMWTHYLDWKVNSCPQITHYKNSTLLLQQDKGYKKKNLSSKEGVESLVDRELALIEGSLPSVLSCKTFAEKFWVELRRHHRWFEVIFHFSPSCPRSLRVLSLALKIISMLFVQSIIYNVTNPDDGSCATYKTKAQCVIPKSSFGTGGNQCQWQSSDRSCSFIEPSEDITIVIFVAIVSAVIITPIAIQNAEDDQKFSLLAKDNMKHLIASKNSYRRTLTASKRKEFDDLWGLDSSGRFLRDKESSSLVSWLLGSEVSPYNGTLLEIEHVLKREEEELCWVDSKDIPEREKSKRLLQLFQCDLLPGLSADILSSKSARDAVTMKKAVSIRTKIVFYAVIVVANALMLFYILLFAIQQTKHRQQAWFRSFMLWFMTEVLLTCTMVVWVLHYLIPTFIVGDIRKLESKVMSVLSASLARGSGRRDRTNDNSEFNAAKYLFVSRRIAERLPNNPIAKLVLSFQTPWPKHSYQQMNDDKDSSAYRSGLSFGLGNFLGMIAYGLGGFMHLPQGVQDCLLHMVSSVATGYVVLGHEQLFNLYPALAFVPLFCFCIYVHVLLSQRRRKEELHPVRIIAEEKSPDEEDDDGPSYPPPIDSRQQIVAASDQRASLIRGLAMVEDAQQYLEPCHHDRCGGSNDSSSSCYDSPEESDGDDDDDPSINSSASCLELLSSSESNSSQGLCGESIDFRLSPDDVEYSDYSSIFDE
eukprot:gene22213-30453_t